MDPANPQPPASDQRSPAEPRRAGVSPERHRLGVGLAVVVAAVLAITLWQTWDYWSGKDGEPVAADGSAGRRPGLPESYAGFPGGPPGGPGGMFNPEAIRRQLHEQIKTAMDARDEEWATIQPKLEKVTRLQDQLRPNPGGMMGMMPPPGGRLPPPPAPAADDDNDPAAAPQAAAARQPVGSDSELSEKRAMLRAAVEDEGTSAEALAANLAAARAARAKLAADLKTAQDDLRKDLTPRQDAVLVTFGILE